MKTHINAVESKEKTGEEFVHLHVHTDNTIGHSTIRIPELISRLSDLKMHAVAITDNGTLSGVPDLFYYIGSYNMKPIIGCELNIAPEGMFKKQPKEEYRNIILLAKNRQGYQNLCKLVSLGYLKAFRDRPLIDKKILKIHHEGLICLSNYLNAEPHRHLSKGNFEAALSAAQEYQSIFGKDNYFLEISDNGIHSQIALNEDLVKLSRVATIPLVATNNCHYLTKRDAQLQQIYYCIHHDITLKEANSRVLASDQFYFRSQKEMNGLFSYLPGQIKKEAIRNTVIIADRCNVKLKNDHFIFPNIPVKKRLTADELLKQKAVRGLKKRLPAMIKKRDPELLKVYQNRLDEELSAMNKSELAARYFLAIYDFASYAKKKGMPVTGWDNTASSLVAYALNITDVDPIHHGLIFENFFNSHKELEIINVVLCLSPEDCDKVIKYIVKKYGKDKVANVLTFRKISPYYSVSQCAEVLNISKQKADELLKIIPDRHDITLKELLKKDSRLLEIIKKNNLIEFMNIAKRLEGLKSGKSIHASGIVISDIPLVERLPLFQYKKGMPVTQYTIHDLIDTVGFPLFHFLGMKTLSVINDTLALIKDRYGIDMDISAVPLDDLKTFQLLCSGNTEGVFLMSSSSIENLFRVINPNRIEDIIDALALFWPQTLRLIPEYCDRKQGKKEIRYEVSELEDILKETYGIPIYKEQIMKIANIIGCFSMADADNLHKHISVKKPSLAISKHYRQKFLEGAKSRNISQVKAKRIWEQVRVFAGLSRNKSNIFPKALITYQTAYLKAHYPVEFKAAADKNSSSVVRHKYLNK